MQIAITSELSYREISLMTFTERNILVEVVQEKIDAESGKKRQRMVPGEINAPPPSQQPRIENR